MQSFITYNSLLQALVNLNLGVQSLSLEEKLLRDMSEKMQGGLPSVVKALHWANILEDNRVALEKQIDAAKLDASTTPQKLEKLEQDLAQIVAAQDEMQAQAATPVSVGVSGPLLCQFDDAKNSARTLSGIKGFQSTWLELVEAELTYKRMERWNEVANGAVERIGDATGCVVRKPTNQRQGHQHCVVIELQSNDSRGDRKHILSLKSAQDLQMWVEAITGVPGARWKSSEETE